MTGGSHRPGRMFAGAMRGTRKPRFCPPFLVGISAVILLTFVLPVSCEDLSSATNASWSQVGDVITGADDYPQIGSAISLSDDGTRMAVGAPSSDRFRDTNYEAKGRVRVFELHSGSWVQMGSDIIGEWSDKAGSSVALSGNGMRLAVGSPQHSPGGCNGAGCQYMAGRASVYE